MSDLLDVDATLRAAARRWGVWDSHEHRFVAEGYLSEREAWGALVAEVESRHPRLLDVRLSTPEGSVAQESPNDEVECPTCRGDGYCSECGRDCVECDGYATITRKRMEEIEAEQRRREKARREARERRAREREAAGVSA